jgi:predicted unusual protein kinase regulating ubiquinone biosynthesis (AarF/ABC1/UbiB family)
MLIDVPTVSSTDTNTITNNPNDINTYKAIMPPNCIKEYNTLVSYTQERRQHKKKHGKDNNNNRYMDLTTVPPIHISSTDPKTICLVDAGMVAQLSDNEAAVFIGLLSAIGEGDGVMAAQFALQFSHDNNHVTSESRTAFSNDMIVLFIERCRGYGTNVDLGYVLRGVLSLLRKYKIRVDSNFATLVVNVLCIQGLAYDVCPEYNVLDAAKPLLQCYRNLCFTKDGIPNGRNPRTSKIVKLRLWSMYIQKRISDNRFFHNLTQQRRRFLEERYRSSF